ncbi:MAG: GH3 auxin-responsive promoter family protein [Cyclobacteriaceae bacterium]|nr:GH3 auxin-responsive promoter family protein [Cyclobacteriaceae bacterium]MCH8515158.1 GH3 auxin-responsive promoter family protein [Cyclobacteriaceae bacterium]
MGLINSFITWVMRKRIHQIELFMKHPHDVQREHLEKLLKAGRSTAFGIRHGFNDIHSIDSFKEQIPVSDYQDLYPYIDRILKGEQNILWPSEIIWFAKSSGTTSARSKYIPVSQDALEECHFKGGKDMLSLYFNNHNPDSNLFDGKGLAIGGSNQINQFNNNEKTYCGDVSAVIMKNLPMWVQFARTPSLEIALMDEWESKIEKMALATSEENVTSITGVPTWTILLINKILELRQAKDIREIWPNLEVFFHGAVAFQPYQKLFEELIPIPGMNYVETYNASEGFFGIQDQPDSKDLLLMLDYGIYYEFIPMDEFENEHPSTLQLDEVELNKNYAVVITTNAGLWRYKIGDTVRFTSLDPFRIRISGRTKHFINAFGEEVIIENAEAAITQACELTHASIDNFTAGPLYLEGNKKGGHEWIIEFGQKPKEMDRFINVLDEHLRKLNSDYDAKRYKDLALQRPIVHAVPQGTFYQWMKKRGKLGGQNKVPRLSNHREYLEDILSMLKERSA